MRARVLGVLHAVVALNAVGGGAQVAAGLSVAAGSPRAHRVSLAAGAILLGWIGTQVALIGYVSWLQPAVAITALANLALARRPLENVRDTA